MQRVELRKMLELCAACVNGGGAVDRGTALQAGRSRVRFTMLYLEFFIGIILPATLWPVRRAESLTWPVRTADSITTFMC